MGGGECAPGVLLFRLEKRLGEDSKIQVVAQGHGGV